MPINASRPILGRVMGNNIQGEDLCGPPLRRATCARTGGPVRFGKETLVTQMPMENRVLRVGIKYDLLLAGAIRGTYLAQVSHK